MAAEKQEVDAATGTELWGDSAPVNAQAIDANSYTLDRDNLYLGWSCGGG